MYNTKKERTLISAVRTHPKMKPDQTHRKARHQFEHELVTRVHSNRLQTWRRRRRKMSWEGDGVFCPLILPAVLSGFCGTFSFVGTPLIRDIPRIGRCDIPSVKTSVLPRLRGVRPGDTIITAVLIPCRNATDAESKSKPFSCDFSERQRLTDVLSEWGFG